jgi:hypothetical protein
VGGAHAVDAVHLRREMPYAMRARTIATSPRRTAQDLFDADRTLRRRALVRIEDVGPMPDFDELARSPTTWRVSGAVLGHGVHATGSARHLQRRPARVAPPLGHPQSSAPSPTCGQGRTS